MLYFFVEIEMADTIHNPALAVIKKKIRVRHNIFNSSMSHSITHSYSFSMKEYFRSEQIEDNKCNPYLFRMLLLALFQTA